MASKKFLFLESSIGALKSKEPITNTLTCSIHVYFNKLFDIFYTPKFTLDFKLLTFSKTKTKIKKKKHKKVTI